MAVRNQLLNASAKKAADRVQMAKYNWEYNPRSSASSLSRAILSRRASSKVKDEARQLLDDIRQDGEAKYAVVEGYLESGTPEEKKKALMDLRRLAIDYETVPQLGDKLDRKYHRYTALLEKRGSAHASNENGSRSIGVSAMAHSRFAAGL